jgi:hypothetical protein
MVNSMIPHHAAVNSAFAALVLNTAVLVVNMVSGNASKFVHHLPHLVDHQVLSPVHRQVHNVLLDLLTLLQTLHSLSSESAAPVHSEEHVKAVDLGRVAHKPGIGSYSQVLTF